MWDWFINFLTAVLAGIEGFVGDWGLAVIILTVIVRLILTPLMAHSTRSTARMQVMQPKLQEIQERYADDPTRQAEELRKVYAEMKFNPLGGCLPIFLQMPIFFGLFSVVRAVLPRMPASTASCPRSPSPAPTWWPPVTGSRRLPTSSSSSSLVF